MQNSHTKPFTAQQKGILLRAPFERQFERIVGLVKNALYKTVQKSQLE